MSVNLRSDTLFAFARDLTKLAVENQLITVSSDSESTAMEVAKFYRTLMENINQCEK